MATLLQMKTLKKEKKENRNANLRCCQVQMRLYRSLILNTALNILYFAGHNNISKI